jgi:hypothetical protein
MRNVHCHKPSLRPVRFVGVLFLLLAVLGVVGCATVGREFPTERVIEIRIDQTTKTDLLAHFGRPYRRGIEDGDSTWTYVYYRLRLLGGQTQARDLYVRFADEKVSSYTYNFDVP